MEDGGSGIGLPGPGGGGDSPAAKDSELGHVGFVLLRPPWASSCKDPQELRHGLTGESISLNDEHVRAFKGEVVEGGRFALTFNGGYGQLWYNGLPLCLGIIRFQAPRLR